MKIETALESWQAQAAQLPILKDCPSYFKNYQQEALESWKDLAWPAIERVDYQAWPLCQEVLAGDAVSADEDEALSEAESAHQINIIHLGNQTRLSPLSDELKAAGVIVADLFEAMIAYPDLVEQHLFSIVPALADKITAYQTAYLNGGLFIYIPDHCKLPISIDCLLIQDSRLEQAFNKRVLLVAGVNSQIEYLERLKTKGQLANSATITVEVIAQAGAQVKYCALDGFAPQTTTYIKRYASLAADATVNWAIGALNAGHTILDSDTQLIGQGAHSQLAIVAIANEQQVQAIDAKIVNQGHHTIGNILQHGVVLDQATLTFNGIGLIEKQAKHADAQQESRLIMLSDEARGDANPILLIEEFEVTAGHAASVGQLDQQQLYYLMSRGLSRKEAEYLVVRGFLGSVIREMPTAEVREEVIAAIDQRLSSLPGAQSETEEDVAQ